MDSRNTSVWRRIIGQYWAVVFRFAKRKKLHDVLVGTVLADDANAQFAKLDEAIGLIKTFSPQAHTRLVRCGRILIFGTVGPIGEWHRYSRIIQVRENWVQDPATHPVHIAATLVHESTHGWLDERGVRYVAARRKRIERMCYRAEARFAGRVPGCDHISDYYLKCAQDVMSQRDDEWSDHAFRVRGIEYLAQLGTPAWLLNLLRRSVAKKPAV